MVAFSEIGKGLVFCISVLFIIVDNSRQLFAEQPTHRGCCPSRYNSSFLKQVLIYAECDIPLHGRSSGSSIARIMSVSRKERVIKMSLAQWVALEERRRGRLEERPLRGLKERFA
jgi:hypothetical protein